MKGKPMKLSESDKSDIQGCAIVMSLIFSCGISLVINELALRLPCNSSPDPCWMDPDASYMVNAILGAFLIWLVVVVIGICIVFTIIAIKHCSPGWISGAKLMTAITRDTWRQFRAINNDELFEDES